MLLRESQLRKIIQETILSNLSAQNYSILEGRVNRSNILVSTRQGSGYVRFGALLERADRGLIGANQFSLILENDLRNIQKEIIYEGLLDQISDAYQSVKSGAIKLKNKISDTAAAAMAKMNQKYLEWTIKIWQMMQKGKEYALKGCQLISKGMSSIKKFKEKHPILYRIIVTVLIVLVLYAIMAIFGSNDASATVTVGGKPISPDKYNATLGLMKDLAKESTDPDQARKIFDAMDAFDKAQKSGANVPMGDLHDIAKSSLESINEFISYAKEAGPSTPEFESALRVLNDFKETGQNAAMEININGIPRSAPMGI